METNPTETKRTGSWLPFYCWIIGVMIEAVLIWMLPARHRGTLGENILGFLCGLLLIFLFVACPVWMLVSAIRYWRSKDYSRAAISALLAVAIVVTILYAPIL